MPQLEMGAMKMPQLEMGAVKMPQLEMSSIKLPEMDAASQAAMGKAAADSQAAMAAAASRSVEISAQATAQVQNAFGGMFGWAIMPCTTKQGDEARFKDSTIEDAPLPLPGDDGVPVGSFERRIGKTPTKNKKNKNNKANQLPSAPPSSVDNVWDETPADGLQEEGRVEAEAARQVAGDAAASDVEGRLGLEEDRSGEGGDQAGNGSAPVDGNKVKSGEDEEGDAAAHAAVAASREEGGGGIARSGGRWKCEAPHQEPIGAVESRTPSSSAEAGVGPGPRSSGDPDQGVRGEADKAEAAWPKATETESVGAGPAVPDAKGQVAQASAD